MEVGPNNGNDYGQILSRGDSLCPEESSGEWKYWSTTKEEWMKDSTLSTKCDGYKCCDELVVSSSGESKDHQKSRLGRYVKSYSSENGRYTYQKEDEEKMFLFWMKSYNGVWLVCNNY